MKSKKKFLLLGVGVMGALALGVGATSTFAWYAASDTANAVKGTDLTNPNITVSAPTNQTTTYGYIISASIARSGTNSSDTKLLLSEVSNGALLTKMWDAGGELVNYTPASGETAYFQYTVTLTGNWATSDGANYKDASGLTDAAKHALLSANDKVYSTEWTFTGTDAARARIAGAATFANEKSASSNPLYIVNSDIDDFVKLAELPNNATPAQIAQFTGEGQTQTFDIFVRADGDQATDDVEHADTDALEFTVSCTASIGAAQI